VGFSRRMKFSVAAPIGRDVAGVSDGQEMIVRSATELIADLECSSLLAFNPNRVDTVDDLDFAGLAEFAHNPKGIVEIAFNGDGGRTIHERLRKFAKSNVSIGQQNHAFHLRARGVSGGGR